MAEVRYFRAARRSNRFNKNQKVWIRWESNAYYEIRFKFRGKGRYVNGLIDKFNTSIGKIKTMDVDVEFAKRIELDCFGFNKGQKEEK